MVVHPESPVPGTSSRGSTLTWVRPAVEEPVERSRRRALEVMAPPVVAAVRAAWAAELPAAAWPSAEKAVRQGLRTGLASLTCSPRSALFASAASYFGLFGRLPAYWEPPSAAACDEAGIPLHQLRAYRWAAALLAVEVRNHLEPLHQLHTSDDVMPALNRGVRQALYGVLLSDRAIAWRVSALPRACVWGMIEMGAAPQFPAVAG